MEAKLSNFQAGYPFAGRQQGILSLVSLTSTLFSWFKETNTDLGFLLLLNSGILVALTVWTFGFILPINLQLIDGRSNLIRNSIKLVNFICRCSQERGIQCGILVGWLGFKASCKNSRGIVKHNLYDSLLDEEGSRSLNKYGREIVLIVYILE